MLVFYYKIRLSCVQRIFVIPPYPLRKTTALRYIHIGENSRGVPNSGYPPRYSVFPQGGSKEKRKKEYSPYALLWRRLLIRYILEDIPRLAMQICAQRVYGTCVDVPTLAYLLPCGLTYDVFLSHGVRRDPALVKDSQKLVICDSQWYPPFSFLYYTRIVSQFQVIITQKYITIFSDFTR